MNKQTLKYELDYDFVLIAITTPLKDYRLCYTINKQLLIQFYRTDELQLQFGLADAPVYFSKFYYKADQGETEFFLLSNKGAEGYLIPEMKEADYFILIHNYIDKEDLEQLITGLNQISEVLAAIEVDPRRLKSKENLIF
ncbi:MAG: IPExxxVDY family protein [Sphingobacteriaceae bacterium]|nr:IPExxxVDY family protein [Sphingobacteriaceae bacterium]